MFRGTFKSIWHLRAGIRVELWVGAVEDGGGLAVVRRVLRGEEGFAESVGLGCT